MIFLLLYSALGGVRDALIVFSAVPLALSGGIAALMAARECRCPSQPRLGSSRFRASRC